MKEKLIYNSKEYPCRWIYVFDNTYLIGTESLQEELFREGFSYTSSESRNMDEAVFFYIPDSLIEAEETIIRSYVECCIC